jgi:hypothetical protein
MYIYMYMYMHMMTWYWFVDEPYPLFFELVNFV